jgi:hypothetical protein
MQWPYIRYRNGKQVRRLIAMGVVSVVIGVVSWGIRSGHGKGQVSVVFSHFENVPGGRVAVFQVSNNGDTTVIMQGLGQVLPLFAVAWYSGNETGWKLDSLPGDYSGPKPIILAPGRKLSVPTVVPDRETWAVGLACAKSRFARILPDLVWRRPSLANLFTGPTSVVWSGPVSSSTKESHIAAPLGAMTNLIVMRP